MFPMLGVVIAYESKQSLYTVCRHVPVAMLSLVPLLTTCYVLQEHIGLVPALLVGLVVYFIVLPLFVVPLWNKYDTENQRITSEEHKTVADKKVNSKVCYNEVSPAITE